jgi:hypothetical protein
MKTRIEYSGFLFLVGLHLWPASPGVPQYSTSKAGCGAPSTPGLRSYDLKNIIQFIIFETENQLKIWIIKK